MIIAENVVKTYSSDVAALNGINLHIQKGEFVFIVGKSGSGKSTLIKLLLKELEPTEGKIYVNKKYLNKLSRKKLPYLRRDIGVVFQDFQLLPDRTVRENLDFVLRATDWKKTAKREERIKEVLQMVRLADKVDDYVFQLSGGEQQRICIARAILNTPRIILADEPTGNLDSKNGMEVMELLSELNQEGTTVIMVTHSKHDANYAQRIINLFDGQVVQELN